MSILIRILVLIYLLLSASAHATTLGFESPEDRFADHGFSLIGVKDANGPFQLSGSGYETVLTSGQYVAYSILYDPCCGAGFISSSDSFNFLGAYFASAWDPTGILYLEGFRNGELIHSLSADIFRYEKVYVQADFYGIDTLLMRKTAINQIAFDDWSYSRGPQIPLPGSVPLLALALYGLLITRRTAAGKVRTLSQAETARAGS